MVTDIWKLLEEARNAMDSGNKYQRAMIEAIDEALENINAPPLHGWLADGYGFCNDVEDIEVFVHPCDGGWQYRILPTEKFSTPEEAQEAAVKAAKRVR